MAVKQFNTRIQLKRDTSQAWTTANLALLAGEFGWDSTIDNFKIGSGNWNSLNYAIPVGNGTEITTSTVNNFKTLGIGYIDGSKITALTGYTTSEISGDVAASDSLETALAKIEVKANAAGVKSIGGATGIVTIGNGLTSTSGANGSVSTKVNGYLVNNAGTNTDALDINSTKIDSAYTTGNTTNLATVATVTSALGTLTDTLTGTPGAGKTITAFDEVDGKVTATFASISIESSQISDLASHAATSVKGDGTYLEPSTASVGDVTISHKTRTETTGTGTAQNIKVTDDNQSISIITHTFDAAGHETGKTTTAVNFTKITAADLGLSSAMHFIGQATVAADNDNFPAVSGHTGNYESGDVVLGYDTDKNEYIYDGTNWIKLGDESSYALKNTAITASNCLTSTAKLDGTGAITHNTSGVTAGTYATNSSTTLTNGGTFNIPQVTVDTYGHITAASDVTLTLPTITANNAKLSITDGTNTADVFTADASTNSTVTFTGEKDIAVAVTSNGTVTVGHSNSQVTAVTTASALKVAYDEYGHITSSATLTGTDITVTTASYGGASTVSNVQGALDNLAAAVAEGTNGKLYTSTTAQSVVSGGEPMNNDITLHQISKTGNTDDLIQGMIIVFDCGTATTVTDVPAQS